MTQGSIGHKSEPIVTQLGKLARADIQPDDFFANFFQLVRLGLGAEAGNIWLYNSENQQLIPKVKAEAEIGPLKSAPDDVFSNIAYRAIERKMPVLYYPEEGTEVPALKDIGLMSVPVELDSKSSFVVLLARSAGEGRQYTREDVYTLQSLCMYLVLYFAHYQLKNAALLSQRLAKLAEIESDLAGASERDKMAFILANRSRELMFFDRVFAALPKRSGFRIAAVSGVDDVQQNSATVQNIRELAGEVARIGGDWHFTEGYLEKVEDAAIREKLSLYFGGSDFKSILLMRVEDDRGLLAMLAFERRAEGAYSPADFQFIQSFCKISARPLRRAEEYHALPGISLAKKAHAVKLKAIGPARNRFWLKIAALVAVAAILVFGKWDFTVKGDCQMLPYLMTVAAPRIDGAVDKILKREGDAVSKGEVVALLDDREIQNKMRDMRLRIAESQANVDNYRGNGDTARWSVEQKNLEALQVEMEGLEIELEGTKVTSPQNGIIVTPQAEIDVALDAVKQRGAAIMAIADISQLYVEVEVSERDIAMVKPGEKIEFVLTGNPKERMNVTVESVSPSTRTMPGKNVFIARGILDNRAKLARPGQTGSAEIPAGRRTIVYVVFRSTIDWIRSKFL